MKCRSGGISVSRRSIQPSSRVTLVVVDDDLLDALRDLVRRIGQPRAEREQIALQRHAHLVEIRRQAGGPRHAEARLQLVDVAVGDDARIGLADARAVEQAGVARVAGLRVDLHGRIIGGRLAKTRLYDRLPSAQRLRQRFRRNLLAWYRKNGRDLPWRNTDDPYHILVSEIMLQQTQVDRVLPKYHEWLAKYPSFFVLAEAPPAEVSQTWRPLGYNIRPKRLQSIAQQAVEKYDGKLPSDRETLLSFKGIGEYTAGAIRSFAFRERAAILDTNVARVLFRIFVGKGDPKSHAMKKHLWARVGGRAAAQARLRLQPGADGFRRHALQRAQAEVPDLLYEGLLPISCDMRSRSASGNGSDASSAAIDPAHLLPHHRLGLARQAHSDRRTARRSFPDTRA